MCLAKPKIFINAIPKSGTHLAMRCVSLLPGVSLGIILPGHTPYLTDKHSLKDVRRVLKKEREGYYFAGHLKYNKSFVKLLEEEGIKTFLIVRDPRDVVVSYMYFIIRVPAHYLHKLFLALPDDETRLRVAIRGLKIKRGGQQLSLPGIADVYRGYEAWVQEEKCCLIRFEDLIGEKGGGEVGAQRAAIKKMCNFLAINLTEKQLVDISKRIYYKKEVTFRKGRIGDWQNHFSEGHKRIFKRTAGRTLIDWGYESDRKW